MQADDHLDLRGGHSLWESSIDHRPAHNALNESTRTRIAIIGSGITGSFLAERLSRLTSSIVVLDRHRPQTASTAASTSLLQWELDTPLSELSGKLGSKAAGDIYQASALAVRDILTLNAELDIDCHCMARPSLYVCGNRLGRAELGHEHRQREQFGLPSQYVAATELQRIFGFTAEAALYSEGAAEANPVALAQGLMQAAVKRGVQFHFPETVIDFDLGSRAATILTESGHEVRSDILILANGYEMPDFVPSKIHRVTSTWALATRPAAHLWPRHALIWEASSPYLYARQNVEGRIVLGGEDEEMADAERRDQKIAAKADTIRHKFNRLYPAFNTETEFSWTGFFGVTDDGLPLIGALPEHHNVFAAFGYGGNGITFSFMAAQLVTEMIYGKHNPLLEHFAVDRE